MFHFFLFWYNQLNFLKLSLRKIMMFSLQKNIFMQYLFLGLRLDFSFGGLIYQYASNFIPNKGHIFMNFDGMILKFYTWPRICAPGQVLEVSSLQVWT